MSPRILLLTSTFCLAALTAACGGSQSNADGGKVCNASTCASGCCDANGVCQPGVSTSLCGKGGAVCRMCGTGQTCASQACFGGSPGGGSGGSGGSSGGGSGGSGGGSGGAGGGSVTCRKIGFFDAGFSEGLYDNIDLAAAGQPPDLLWFNATRAWSTAPTAQVAVGRDRIDLELWYQGTFASAPATESYDATSKYLKCDVCVIYWEGYIPSTDQYDRAYFPQAGSATVSQATQSADGGTMAGTGSNLKLVEWDLDADEPVAGGQCIEMPAATFSSSW